MLAVEDLAVHFPTEDGLVKAVDGVSFTLAAGKTVGIVGESGSGKSVSSSAIMGLQRGTSAQVSGSIKFDGRELTDISDEEYRHLRGKDIAMIFQDPLSAMHPYYTVGAQIVEAYRVHNPKASKKEARERTLEMLSKVGIPSPARRIDQYPHEFSGGMRQRAMVAMALINNPKLLIADEPTTALDVTVQAQILDLMVELQDEFGSAIIIITHDLGVVADIADDILVMYAGRPVEKGAVLDTFARPKHPYTWGLLASMPRLDRPKADKLDPIPGNPPSLINLPRGCSFNPRCAYSGRVPERKCFIVEPELYQIGTQEARCFLTDKDRDEIAGDPESDNPEQMSKISEEFSRPETESASADEFQENV
ncbi:MAG: ABC transporter ATP-binding protein [Actinomycetota bacterium]|nr:ABC transporter ATP-binding protein [Actinomycetota bacterium]